MDEVSPGNHIRFRGVIESETRMITNRHGSTGMREVRVVRDRPGEGKVLSININPTIAIPSCFVEGEEGWSVRTEAYPTARVHAGPTRGVVTVVLNGVEILSKDPGLF